VQFELDADTAWRLWTVCDDGIVCPDSDSLGASLLNQPTMARCCAGCDWLGFPDATPVLVTKLRRAGRQGGGRLCDSHARVLIDSQPAETAAASHHLRRQVAPRHEGVQDGRVGYAKRSLRSTDKKTLLSRPTDKATPGSRDCMVQGSRAGRCCARAAYTGVCVCACVCYPLHTATQCTRMNDSPLQHIIGAERHSAYHRRASMAFGLGLAGCCHRRVSFHTGRSRD
jgi:hypothetical protein